MLQKAYHQLQGTHNDTNFGFSTSVLYTKNIELWLGYAIHTVSECAKFIKNEIYIGR
jgi:hypothetical protein